MTAISREYLEIGVSPSGKVLTTPASVLEDWIWAAPAGTWRDEPGVTESLLLTLAASDTPVNMPPAWGYWCDFARSYITALCHLADPVAEPPLPGMEQLASLVESVPPMPGGEYVTPVVLARLWERLGSRMREEAAECDDGVTGWLKAHNPAWRLVGKVCFHLAENKKDPERPFAFLATYSPRLSARGRAQHAPLANALREFAGEKNKAALLKLLSPVQFASEKSALARELVDSGRKIASSFWGKAWCNHMESFHDFENRLPRGRSYVRNGSVVHLEIARRLIKALVAGSKTYSVSRRSFTESVPVSISVPNCCSCFAASNTGNLRLTAGWRR